MALAQDSSDRDALETSLAIHEALLDRSGRQNFWEVAWLEKEISRVRGLLEAN